MRVTEFHTLALPTTKGKGQRAEGKGKRGQRAKGRKEVRGKKF
jgi:hypothetical protein